MKKRECNKISEIIENIDYIPANSIIFLRRKDFEDAKDALPTLIELRKLYGSTKGKGKVATKKELEAHIKKVFG